MPLIEYLKIQGYTEEKANEIELEYQMIIRLLESPNDLYDIVSWLGWFDEDQEEI